jgi:hypothetical protein
MDHIFFGSQIWVRGATHFRHIICWQNAAARRGKRPSSSAEKACERLSERLWPVPSGSVTFPFIQKAAHAKEKGARRRHGSRAARASAGCRLRRAHYLSRILISAERCYIILMRGTHSPMCNSMSTWPVIKRRALALISDNGSGRRRRQRKSAPRKKDFSLWTNLVLACVCVCG